MTRDRDFEHGDRVLNIRSGTHGVVNSVPRDEGTHPYYRTITVYVEHPLGFRFGPGRYPRWRRRNVRLVGDDQ